MFAHDRFTPPEADMTGSPSDVAEVPMRVGHQRPTSCARLSGVRSARAQVEGRQSKVLRIQ
jgi:hypothetical protein